MSEVQNILKQIEDKPTIMDIADEISYIERLQFLDNWQIAEDLTAFLKILNRLMDSHTDNIFAVNDHNLPILKKFSQKLRDISVLFDDKTSEALNVYADDFSVNPKNYSWNN